MKDEVNYRELCHLSPLAGRSQPSGTHVKEEAGPPDPIAEWNRDVDMACRDLLADIDKNRDGLLPPQELATVPEAARPWLYRYAVADTLALYFREKLRIISRNVIVLALAALLAFELAHWLTHWGPAWANTAAYVSMTAFVFLLGVVVYLHRRERGHRLQHRYQDYRTLAEGLRVQFYWAWAGCPEKVQNNYPHRFRSELGWIRDAKEQWDTPPVGADAMVPEKAALLPFRQALTCWIDNQLGYYSGKTKNDGAIIRNRCLNERCRSIGEFCFYSAIVLGAIAVVLMWLGALFIPEAVVYHSKYFLVFLAGVCIVVAAACYGWRERFAYAEHVVNFTAMSHIYQAAQEQLKQEAEPVNDILLRLGREALSESTDWLLLHRERHATHPRL